MGERYGPNDLMPCGTDAARRRHLARGEDCPACGTNRLDQEGTAGDRERTANPFTGKASPCSVLDEEVDCGAA